MGMSAAASTMRWAATANVLEALLERVWRSDERMIMPGWLRSLIGPPPPRCVRLDVRAFIIFGDRRQREPPRILMALVDQLYDAGRSLHYAKPRWRGRLHLAWFAMLLVAGPWLVLSAPDSRSRWALAVYAVGVAGLFGVSALYHCGTWSVAAGRVLQRWDHVMIFVLIAATGTPVFLLGTPAPFGLICLGVTWAITVVVIIVHLAWMHAPEAVVGGTFIGLGSSAAVAVPALWVASGVIAVVLVVVGGVLYASGALLYHWRRPDPWPATFGYHEVFHALVCAGATCHFLAIAIFLR